MTYRDRREARADRLRGWAEKRETDAVATLNSNPEMRGDWAFITQPGHIPERARIIARDERAFKSLDKAERMASRADGIESQLAGAIYSDDVDAVEALEARIAGLEAKRDRYKAHNKTMRKAGACDHAADCDCRSMFPRDCNSCKNHPLPSYMLTNLSGDIKRNKDRLEVIKRQQARTVAAEDAGGVTVERSSNYAIVTFAEKPDREIINSLKAAGYRWAKGSWVGTADQLPEGITS